MKNNELKPKVCPNCGAEPILIEYGTYATFSCTGLKKTKLTPQTYHYECACGLKGFFRMTTKRMAIVMWNRKEEGSPAVGTKCSIIHDDPKSTEVSLA